MKGCRGDSCALNPDCDALLVCLDMCDPADPNYEMCRDNCFLAYSEGTAGYNAIVACTVCQECPVSCNAPAAGCP